MGILDLCSYNSYWRGYHYFKGGKVKEINKIGDDLYECFVEGTETYKVQLDVNHPRKSTCNCPYADGKRIICKHIVASYLAVNPKEVLKIDKEVEDFEKEKQAAIERYDSLYKETYERVSEKVKNMSNDEVRQLLINRLVYESMESYDEEYDEYFEDDYF